MKKKKELSREQLQAEAISLYIAGLSVREIARRLNSSPATISRILAGQKNTITTPANNVGTVASKREQRELVQSLPSESNLGDSHIAPLVRDENRTGKNFTTIIDKTHTAVIDIITQIQRVTDGETDIAKLATAADKLSTIAERITNLSHLADNNNNQSIFAADFLNRHQQKKKNS